MSHGWVFSLLPAKTNVFGTYSSCNVVVSPTSRENSKIRGRVCYDRSECWHSVRASERGHAITGFTNLEADWTSSKRNLSVVMVTNSLRGKQDFLADSLFQDLEPRYATLGPQTKFHLTANLTLTKRFAPFWCYPKPLRY